MILDQVRRLRVLNAQQKTAYEAQLAAMQAKIDSLTAEAAETAEVQAELNAFETDLTPVAPVASTDPGTPTS